MNTFFDFLAFANHNLTIYEKLFPMLVTFLLILLLFVARKRILRHSFKDGLIRGCLAGLLLASFLFEYIPRYSQVGINRFNLPIHLCSIGGFLCLFLLYTNSKHLYGFICICCIPGAFLAILGPSTLSRSFLHVQYYTFMVLHSIIILTVSYYFIVYRYEITIPSIIVNLLILQALTLLVGTMNDLYGTFYWYITFTRDMFLYTPFAFLGGGVRYFFVLELLALLLFGGWGGLCILITRLSHHLFD